ncbi:hypothetical protein LLE49_04035 [Alicyclobacillus tolerans]|uniref:hypothetical protein n=1 Tax=Alicyclobacillus tolerans TaxID=90970 RepID=UPI001F43AEAA|nr:hypothetical protein [Alicyclobacillus tolerans]MCF8563907.1 hypothetical protein [Alicyclobacillus tolerans]
MKKEPSLEHLKVFVNPDAPPVEQWLQKELQRWLSDQYHQKITVQFEPGFAVEGDARGRLRIR